MTALCGAPQLKWHGEDALPSFTTTLLPVVVAWLDLRDRPSFRGVAFCVMDDLLEHCSPASLSLMGGFLPHLLDVRAVV